MIIMCSVNFTLLIFSLRTGTRGTFYLVGAYARASIVWSILEYLGFSVEFASRRHSGMLALVILPLL
jgi:hypothetical protein